MGRNASTALRPELRRHIEVWLYDRVLLEAKRLLIHSSLPPAAIGEHVGFTYPTVFSAFFRRRTGMTPTGFRSLTKP